MKNIFLTIAAATALCATSQAQILVSGGTYTQNFDSLSSGPTSTGTWADNTTLSGWYGARAYTSGTTSALGSYPYTTYRVSGGEMNTGWIYSFGTNGVGAIEDRAFGSLSSGTPKTNAFGFRILNDTANPVSLTLSYTGEQWRVANTAPNTLAFSYRVSGTPVTDIAPNNTADWTEVAGLNFVSPNISTATGVAIDGNAAENRQLFSNVLIPVEVGSGQEIFLRWLDTDDSGSDQALAIDDLTLSFAVVPEPTTGVLIGLGLLGMALWRRRQ